MIGDFLSEVFVGIILFLDCIIYTLIDSAYRIFMAIASARLLSSDVYYDIASRIYIVIGVLMLFVLSYAILKAIIDPDQATKGELGPGMIKRVIIAVIGLAITPVLFNLLYQAQGLFLEQDVLGKIFFRIENTESVTYEGQSTNPDKEIKNIGGAVAATSIWQAFFHPADGYDAAEIKSDATEYYGAAIGTGLLCALGIAAGVVTGILTWGLSSVLTVGAVGALCLSSMASNIESGNELMSEGGEITLEAAYSVVAGGGDFAIFTVFIDNYIEEGEIEYFWGVSTICGAFALYAFVSFSIDMGVRAAKLAYYQIIAPVPLVMQVLPKYKDTFSKYIKNVVSTFLEVFIRISVVYIVVYIVCHLQDLFSSFGSLWGNDSLNLAEKSLALALLVIGLVIFAKSAPDLICQSLNIEKGSMKLGIGKKLADGGAYAGLGVAGAGLTSAVQNWRNTKGHWGQKAMSALGGMGSAATRAAFNQFGPGPGRKPAMTWGDVRSVADRAAQAAADKRDSRDARQADHAAAQTALEAAQLEFDNAAAELENARNSGASQDVINAANEKLNKARATRQDALARFRATTAMGAWDENFYKKVDAYTIGTVDLSKEQADMKFAAEMNKLKDTTRDEAMKKDETTKALKSKYDDLMAKQVSEYRDGWSADSYNERLRQRFADGSTEAQHFRDMQAAYNMARRDYDAKKGAVDAASRDVDTKTAEVATKNRELTAARERGASAAEISRLQGELSTAQTALTASQATLSTSRTALNTAAQVQITAEADLTSARKVISDALDLEAKRSVDEIAAERTRLEQDRKAAKDTYEAAADAYVARELATEGSIVRGMVENVISANAAYISANSERKITIGFDDTGKPKTATVSDIVGKRFGDSAVSSGTVSTEAVREDNSITITDHAGTEDIYDMKFNDTTNKWSYVSRSDSSKTFSLEDFAEKVMSKAKKAEANTNVTSVSKDGKNAGVAIPQTEEYKSKVTRQRQAEDSKSGKK